MDNLKENVCDEEFDLEDEEGWPNLQASGLVQGKQRSSTSVLPIENGNSSTSTTHATSLVSSNGGASVKGVVSDDWRRTKS
ncbi:hypothetical protein KY290_007917 [Solanum tuberosum]|uniref:Uncharacterized protein n=1 Tax=Solanum tuberosum TaxID=4113 RepID=A0ABQ7W889_SOLTU|nr:hypothetical protein KY290_007917 [Solanum tuberosum]